MSAGDRAPAALKGRVVATTTAPRVTAAVSHQERETLDRAAGGDEVAFDALIRPRLARLFRLAMAITRDAADAQDALQDACVAAWRDLPRLRDRSRFDAWLSQILVNACRGELRRRRRVAVREIDVDLATLQESPGLATHGPDDGFGEMEAIRRAFGRLDPDVRTLLHLHYVEQRPLAEIGAITQAPVGTIKWRLWNARRALERALKEERR
jgi:RNA polymerase sigma-70 factor (ECF subfamily)